MTQQDTNGSLVTTIEKNIATVQFGHPASNSFPRILLDRLTTEINRLSDDQNVSIIVLKSDGTKAFCAGASFDELLAVTTLEEGTLFFSGFAHLLIAMRNCQKIIIGRIHGKAVGGGVGIIAACDYALATQESAIKLSELAIGIGPFVIEPVITRKIGKIALSEMALEAHDWKTADWAFQKGLYAKIFETTSALDIAIDSICHRLAGYNPEALNQIKKIFWEGTENWSELLLDRAAISGKLVLSNFTKNALIK